MSSTHLDHGEHPRRTELTAAARLSALVEGLPGGVVMVDAWGTIVDINPAAVRLLGEPTLHERFPDVMRRATVTPDGPHEHTQLSSGRFVNISRRELDGGGEVVLLTDVTEAHSLQMLLMRQQRLLTLGELAAGLAHQIRTPLATALLYASQMLLPPRDRSSQRDDAALSRCAVKTVDSLKQLDRLVNDMLAFAHGGATREPVNVSAVLEQVAQWLRPVMRKGVRLTIRTQAPNLTVRANAPSLVSAVLNLASNALQTACSNLELELLARRSADGRAQIVVSDNGPGIPERVRERIFEPFFTTRAQGNGIGLAIVKSVIEAHGGTVSLAAAGGDFAGSTLAGRADTGAGPGATFIIDLPAEDST